MAEHATHNREPIAHPLSQVLRKVRVGEARGRTSAQKSYVAFGGLVTEPPTSALPAVQRSAVPAFAALSGCSLAARRRSQLSGRRTEIAVDIQPNEPHLASFIIDVEGDERGRTTATDTGSQPNRGRSQGRPAMSTGSRPKEQHGLPTLRSPTTPQRPSDTNLNAPPDTNAAAVFSSRYVKRPAERAGSDRR